MKKYFIERYDIQSDEFDYLRVTEGELSDFISDQSDATLMGLRDAQIEVHYLLEGDIFSGLHCVYGIFPFIGKEVK